MRMVSDMGDMGDMAAMTTCGGCGVALTMPHEHATGLCMTCLYDTRAARPQLVAAIQRSPLTPQSAVTEPDRQKGA